MRIHFVHTWNRPDRLASIIKEMKEQDHVDYYISQGPQTPGNVLLSISGSHKTYVKMAYDTGMEEICIAENDLHLFAPGALKYFFDHKPNEFDLYLGGVFHGHIDDKGLIQDFCGLSLYIVSKRFYRLFLSVKDIDNIDRALAVNNFNPWIRSSLKYYVCDPFVCTQHGGWSDSKQHHVESYDHLLQGRRLFGQ